MTTIATAPRDEYRDLGWVGLGWVAGLAVLLLAGEQAEEDLRWFVAALAVAFGTPMLVWLIWHRRLPKVGGQRRTAPYRARNAIGSLLGCFTLPAIIRAMDDPSVLLMWLLAGAMMTAFAMTVAVVDRLQSPDHPGFGPFRPDAMGLATLLIVVSLATLSTWLANQLVGRAVIVPRVCGDVPHDMCDLLQPTIPSIDPWILIGAYGLFFAGVAAWWYGQTVIAFLCFGVPFVGLVLWSEHVWRMQTQGSLFLGESALVLGLQAGAAILLLIAVGGASAGRRGHLFARPAPEATAEYVVP